MIHHVCEVVHKLLAYRWNPLLGQFHIRTQHAAPSECMPQYARNFISYQCVTMYDLEDKSARNAHEFTDSKWWSSSALKNFPVEMRSAFTLIYKVIG